jgi:hypothetical protein
VFDTPKQISAPFKSKEALESAQLEKYRRDHLVYFGFVPFEEVKRGNDPPDFIVKGTQGDLTIDCTALALEGRRRAEALFNRLVERLVNRGSSGWKNLASCNVSVTFNEASQLPPRKHDSSVDVEIEAGLASIVVNHARLAQFSAEVRRDGFPSEWPSDVKIPQFRHERFSLVVNPVANWQPRDQLSASLGFHLNLQYAVAVTLHNFSSELNRVVTQHDNPATQQLLLSIGGPGLNGYFYPAESMLGELLRNNPLQQVEARYIERVTAHIWETGDIIDIPIARPK